MKALLLTLVMVGVVAGVGFFVVQQAGLIEPMPFSNSKEEMIRNHAWWIKKLTSQQVKLLVNKIAALKSNDVLFIDRNFATAHGTAFRRSAEDVIIAPDNFDKKSFYIYINQSIYNKKLTIEQAADLLIKGLDRADFQP